MTPAGTLTTIHTFDGTDGSNPFAGLTLGTNGTLFGTTNGGGANGYGTIFNITTSGTLTVLHSFAEPDGEHPQAPLTLGSDGNLYGVTLVGGTYNFGTIFKNYTYGRVYSSS